ncbi:MAG: hypothetical protein QXP20_05475 [Candidatus Bathyarchaeia archaeon]
MLNFDEELAKWARYPLARPNRLISTFKQNSFSYLDKIGRIDAPIEFCKKVFLPNHLTWFLKDKNFVSQTKVAIGTQTSKKFFGNLIKATINLYRVQSSIKKLLNQNKISYFYSDKNLINKSIGLLKLANKYEILRVSYNSQIRQYIDKRLSSLVISQDELHTILTPTYGTIYTFLAEEYLKGGENIDFIAKNYFAKSRKDAEIKFPSWKEFVDRDFIRKRNDNLSNILLEKKKLYRVNKELVWIDGLITFDNLIDKLIVYSGILRHDTFLKLALFSNSSLSPEEVFKLKSYFPTEK